MFAIYSMSSPVLSHVHPPHRNYVKVCKEETNNWYALPNGSFVQNESEAKRKWNAHKRSCKPSKPKAKSAATNSRRANSNNSNNSNNMRLITYKKRNSKECVNRVALPKKLTNFPPRYARSISGMMSLNKDNKHYAELLPLHKRYAERLPYLPNKFSLVVHNRNGEPSAYLMRSAT